MNSGVVFPLRTSRISASFILSSKKGCNDGDIPEDEKSYTVCSELSWSHYRLLMRVEDPAARGYYIGEAISQNWSVRALGRQIDSLYFERLLAKPRPGCGCNRSKGSDAAAC